MAFFNNTVDSDQNQNAPRMRIFNDKEKKKNKEMYSWILKYGNESELKLFKNFIEFINPVYQANKFEVIDKQKAYFLSHIIGLRNGGSVILKNANTLKNKNLYISNISYKDDVKIIFRKDSPEGKVLGELDFNKDKNLSIWNEGLDQKKVSVLKIPTLKKPFDLHISAHTNKKVNNKDVLFDFEWISFLPDIPGKNQPGFSKIQDKFLKLLVGTKFSNLHPVMLENPKHLDRKTFVFDRGNWMTTKDEVKPDVPMILNDWDEKWGKNRLGFSKWITSKENPLTARTIVNRIWYKIFGRGIVNSIEDMGTQSETPSHPALLDWLAYEFMNEMNWSIKKLIKTILMSSTYRQNSIISNDKLSIDPNNIYYSRGPRLRLEAEQIRDQALFVSGLLSKKMYGPGVMPPQPDGIWESPYNSEKWIESKGEDKHRKSIYTFIKRTSPYPSLTTFDVNMREVCYVKRIPTNTPLQALVTMNDPVFLEAALEFAKIHSTKNYENAIKDMYESAIYRNIEDEKLSFLLNLYLESINFYSKSPEELKNFFGLDSNVSKKIASLTIVANAIMNLDEFLTHG